MFSGRRFSPNLEVDCYIGANFTLSDFLKRTNDGMTTVNEQCIPNIVIEEDEQISAICDSFRQLHCSASV